MVLGRIVGGARVFVSMARFPTKRKRNRLYVPTVMVVEPTMMKEEKVSTPVVALFLKVCIFLTFYYCFFSLTIYLISIG